MEQRDVICPACGSKKIEYGKPVGDRQRFTVEGICFNCERSWDENYVLETLYMHTWPSPVISFSKTWNKLWATVEPQLRGPTI